jgi:formylglycine-generating enzyme
MMYRITQFALLISTGIAVSLSAQSGQSGDMALIAGGEFLPFYNLSEETVNVEPFYLDKYPVTNAEYLEFVSANPEWRRSQVKKIFADEGYLKKWSGDLETGPYTDSLKNSPVTNVSWFAARAYAKWKGKRLPTLEEWEFAASASRDKPMAARDEMFVREIMNWYSKPNPGILPAVGQNDPNYFGVHDLHGLIWEWVLDFNTVFISGESRADQGDLKQFYCAAGSAAASDTDKANYAAFLRYAFRGSLGADFSVGNLGFRLAMDYKTPDL